MIRCRQRRQPTGPVRSINGGASFQSINDDSPRFGRLAALAAVPLEFGTANLAPEGRGAIVGRHRAAA